MVLVGANAAEGATVTIPAHAVGDLIVIYAFRDGSTTNPTVPTGWTTLTNTLDGTTCSVSVGYRVATVNNTTSGTWTNATQLACVVLRGQKSSGTLFGTAATQTGTANPAVYPAQTVVNRGGSYLVSFMGHRDATTMSALTTMKEVARGGTTALVIANTLAEPHDNWASESVSHNGTQGWIAYVIEVFDEGNEVANYQSVRANSGNTGIISVTEKVR